MANAHSDGANHGSVKSYLTGFILSVILTVIPFAMVMSGSASHSTILAVVVGMAVIQVIVHLYYFLHLDRSIAQRNNVIAFVFTAIVILLLVGLSLWIMFSIHFEMLAK